MTDRFSLNAGGPFTVVCGLGETETLDSFADAVSRHRVLARAGRSPRIYGDRADGDGDADGYTFSDGLTEEQREVLDGAEWAQTIGDATVYPDGSIYGVCSDCGGAIPLGSACEGCRASKARETVERFGIFDGKLGGRVGGTFKTQRSATTKAEKMNAEYGSYRYFTNKVSS